MAVFELKAEVPTGTVDVIEELLGELEEQRLMVVEDRPSAKAWLAGYFPSRAEAAATWQAFSEAARSLQFTIAPEVRELPDEDWKNSYKIHFKASKFGRLNWVPIWEQATFVVPAAEEVLWLDPGMAFGTGNHETTRLCCERLTDFSGLRGQSGRVIDAGCGSGILALSAAKLGFQRLVGFDNDPEAIRVSGENAELNGMTGRVDFFVGDLISGLADRQADLVMANIQSDVLMRFAPELCRAVAPGGELVLSGILSRELEEVKAKFANTSNKWTAQSRVLGEWADLKLTN